MESNEFSTTRFCTKRSRDQESWDVFQTVSFSAQNLNDHVGFQACKFNRIKNDNIHDNQDIVVVGCGSSGLLTTYWYYQQYWTQNE